MYALVPTDQAAFEAEMIPAAVEEVKDDKLTGLCPAPPAALPQPHSHTLPLYARAGRQYFAVTSMEAWGGSEEAEEAEAELAAAEGEADGGTSGQAAAEPGSGSVVVDQTLFDDEDDLDDLDDLDDDDDEEDET